MVEARTPSFLTPGTAEWNEITPRYTAEAARIIQRETSRLPRLLKDMRKQYATQEKWQAFWAETGVNPRFIERVVEVYREELVHEGASLRARKSELAKQTKEAHAQVERFRAEEERVDLRLAEIQYDLAPEEPPEPEPELVPDLEFEPPVIEEKRARPRGAVTREILLYVQSKPEGVTGQQASLDLGLSPKYVYKLYTKGLLHKHDKLYFVSEAGQAALGIPAVEHYGG